MTPSRGVGNMTGYPMLLWEGQSTSAFMQGSSRKEDLNFGYPSSWVSTVTIVLERPSLYPRRPKLSLCSKDRAQAILRRLMLRLRQIACSRGQAFLNPQMDVMLSTFMHSKRVRWATATLMPQLPWLLPIKFPLQLHQWPPNTWTWTPLLHLSNQCFFKGKTLEKKSRQLYS